MKQISTPSHESHCAHPSLTKHLVMLKFKCALTCPRVLHFEEKCKKTWNYISRFPQAPLFVYSNVFYLNNFSYVWTITPAHFTREEKCSTRPTTYAFLFIATEFILVPLFFIEQLINWLCIRINCTRKWKICCCFQIIFILGMCMTHAHWSLWIKLLVHVFLIRKLRIVYQRRYS